MTERQYRARERKAVEQWRDTPRPWRSITGSWEQMLYETFAPTPRSAAMVAMLALVADHFMTALPDRCVLERDDPLGCAYWVTVI